MMNAMSESCAKALSALKAILTEPSSYNPFCIGTSEMFWRKIKTEGLTPIVCSASGVCADTTYDDIAGRNLNRTWIGRKDNKMCSVYARRAVKKSAGAPLKITFNTQLNVSGMRPSKEFIEDKAFDVNNVNLNDIPNASMHLQTAKSACSPEELKALFEELPDWSKSLISKKSANFVSMVGINPISIENLEETEPISSQWND